MADYSFYFSLLVTALLWWLVYVRARNNARLGKSTPFKIKLWYSALSIAVGFISGTVIFYGAMWFLEFLGYQVFYGHGEILVAAPLANILLGAFLWLIGLGATNWRQL